MKRSRIPIPGKIKNRGLWVLNLEHFTGSIKTGRRSVVLVTDGVTREWECSQVLDWITEVICTVRGLK